MEQSLFFKKRKRPVALAVAGASVSPHDYAHKAQPQKDDDDRGEDHTCGGVGDRDQQHDGEKDRQPNAATHESRTPRDSL
jgi:hypothetical protein